MAIQNINVPDNAHRPPNTGDGSEFGDNFQSAMTKINAMMADLYGGTGSTAKTNTAISTVGAGTLTAAGIAGEVITRTGSTAAYSDATDTAAAIIAARSNAKTGTAWFLYVKNNVGFPETITAGATVTLAGLTVGPQIGLPDAAQGVALSADGTMAWVTQQAGGLVPVTLATGTTGLAIHLGGHPSAIVIGAG